MNTANERGQDHGAEPGARRLAAIDVGTNSIRLIVVEAFANGTYRLLDDEKAITRLGRGFAVDGLLHPQPMEESAHAIARMKTIADGYAVERLRCVGTCAVREATNAPTFVAMVRERTGVTVEPISAEEEARLAYLSVASAFDLSQTQAAVVDVGGGSTEIVLSSRGAVEQVFTAPLGAVRLTERFGECGADDQRAFERMRRRVEKTLDGCIAREPFAPQAMFGTGGTFTALASMCMQRGGARDGAEVLPFTVRGYEVSRAEVRHTIERLRELPARARARIPGLSPDRAEIIVPGLVIVERVMKRLGVNALRVHDRGIRDGLIQQMIRDAFGGGDAGRAEGRDRMRGVRRFAHLCRYEEPHSVHVTRLALSIFDQLGPLAPPRPEETDWRLPATREMLEAASLLHDVGYLINYAQHHKHSYHLIVHADLPEFTSREVEIIANVARYHRRALPSKKKHRAFGVLSKADRKLVRRLSAILRLADGLDRAHTQAVQAVGVRSEGRAVRLLVEAPTDIGFELWAAEHKGELFRRAFGREISVEWANRPEPLPSAGLEVRKPAKGAKSRGAGERRHRAERRAIR